MRTACYGGVIAQRRSESSFFLKFLILQSQFDLMSISCYLLLEYLFHTASYFLVIVIFLLSDVVRKKMLYHNSGIKIFEITFRRNVNTLDFEVFEPLIAVFYFTHSSHHNQSFFSW